MSQLCNTIFKICGTNRVTVKHGLHELTCTYQQNQSWWNEEENNPTYNSEWQFETMNLFRRKDIFSQASPTLILYMYKQYKALLQ